MEKKPGAQEEFKQGALENPNKRAQVQGKRIANGRFLLTKKIGEGSFGKVFLALDTHEDNRQVAIKAESVACRFP